jgi:hypothetical protein
MQPERDHIGIEIRRRYAWRVAYELGRDDGPRNCRIIWGDAKLLSGGLFDDTTVADIYINFPDPWWKAKHAKRRLVDDGFAAMLARLLQPGASIWVKTDVPAIGQEITEALASVPGLEGPVPFGQDDLPLSYRERSCLALGLPIDRFRFTRPSARTAVARQSSAKVRTSRIGVRAKSEVAPRPTTFARNAMPRKISQRSTTGRPRKTSAVSVNANAMFTARKSSARWKSRVTTATKTGPRLFKPSPGATGRSAC